MKIQSKVRFCCKEDILTRHNTERLFECDVCREILSKALDNGMTPEIIKEIVWRNKCKGALDICSTYLNSMSIIFMTVA